MLALGWACAETGGVPASLQVSVVRPPHDTLRFRAPAEAHPCGHGGGLIVEGLAGGNGVLLRVRGDSLGGDFPLLPRGDTTSPRGALVGVRWTTGGDDARGVSLDSGRVTLRRPEGSIEAQVSASGLELTAGQRVKVELSFAAVPLSPDTVSCQARL